MLFFFICFGLMLSVSSEDFDYFTYDYCKLNCKDVVHSACKCNIVPPREEVVENPDPVKFRQVMLDAHNKRRSYLATGQEKRPTEDVIGTASNMMIMNYNLELEHIARCYAVNSFIKTDPKKSGHDKCRRRYGNKTVGQNLFGSSAKPKGTEELEEGWYDEVVGMTVDRINRHQESPPGVHLGHFTQMVWWSANMLGCWRAWNPENYKPWHFLLICNYGTTLYGVEDAAAGNLEHHPVYKRGEPCSHCPKGNECDPANSKTFPGLCGKLYPAPKDVPRSMDKWGIIESVIEANETTSTKTPSAACSNLETNKIFLVIILILSIL